MIFDSPTLSYLGYTAVALSMFGVYRYMTSDGIPALGLKTDDLQLIAKGAIIGALHSQNIDSILSCLKDPDATVKEFEDAAKHFVSED